MKITQLIVILFLTLITACAQERENKESAAQKENLPVEKNLIAVLDTIWQTEQTPIHLRDSLMRIYGAESNEYKEQQLIYEKNHIINEKKSRIY
ncbi:hypothetical protein [Winogradskyella sp. PG-2]|uniref:hypothetical protein n=1 Tax=Winogradskyella sp. PG-2 TaxID=754409 RepID=UPI0004588482|nr:hypothetical protein [Winogradskyella sp. PG-2]BAO77346.1 hypothetical protein WPG_3116 [Winogradskyella sp. PG-2]